MGRFPIIAGQGNVVGYVPPVDQANGRIYPPATESLVRTSLTVTGTISLLTVRLRAINVGTSSINLINVDIKSQDPTSTTAYPGWGDANGNNRTDVKDILYVIKSWFTEIGDPNYNPNADFDGTSFIDVMDLAITSSNFGRIWDGTGSPPQTPTLSDIPVTLQDSSVTPVPDTTPPTTTIYLQGTPGSPPWYISDVVVTLTANDPGSGIAQTDYSFDGVTWITYTNPFDVTAEGTTTIYYNSTDNTGNTEPTKSETVYVDKNGPLITISSPTAQSYPQSGTLTINFNAVDTTSGVASVTATVGQDPATIYIDPTTSMALVGQPFTVTVCVADVVDLLAWQFSMSFDPSILECNNVAIPPDNVFAGRTIISPGPTIDNSAGTLAWGTTILGGEPTFTGTGKLCEIQFTPKSVGTSTLTFTNTPVDTLLYDSNILEIPFTAEDGFFTTSPFVEEHDVAVTGVAAIPSFVVAGEPVTILVDVQNQGNSAETFDITAYFDSNAIATQTVTLLPFGGTTTLTFNWDTTGVPLGLYEIKAEASPVAGETDINDNTFTDGQVSVMIPVTSGQQFDLSTLEPGEYVLTVIATDNAGNTATSSVTFNVINTPAGTNVVVPIPDAALDVTFTTVTGSGTTQATTSNTGPSVPTGFTLGNPPLYYDITTTATYSGQIQIAIDYDSRFTNEANLRLLQWDSGTDEWLDVTTNIDTTNHIIYGQVSHLSIFAVVRAPSIPASIDVNPDTLNLMSNGKWITSYIELPEGYNVRNINASTVLLNNTIPAALSTPLTIGDYDSDGIPDLMVKFDRASVAALILRNCVLEHNTAKATLTLSGKLEDETPFQGSATIVAMLPRGIKI